MDPTIKKKILLGLLIIGVVVSCLYHLTQKADIYYQQGHRLFVKGKQEEAIPYFEKSLLRKPTYFDCQKELAYSYLWTDRIKNAIDIFKKILQEHPDKYDIKFSLAEAYAWSNKYEESISLLQEIIAETNDLEVRLFLADIYLWDTQPLKSIALLEDIVKEDPNNTNAEMLLGKAYYYAGENQKASQVLEKLLQQKQNEKESAS